ncbi:MAG: membrane protein insertase YidC [Flavobacteriaceae bacterium]|nr:membrane protein insertase YidC [Flavobacteriaceae bacterium]MCY4267858.1 membrane protein insertase YidC [Flavobacteriaceae bacterium]MCY4299367.1 membrane protein insertase YidC [Flavobacteriaceae bacterium]
MEEKKFDPFQLVGFILIAGIITWMMYRNSEARNEALQQQEILDQEAVNPTQENTPSNDAVISSDSLELENLTRTYGDFGDWFVDKKQDVVVLENDQLWMEIQSKGGQIRTLRLKEFENYLLEPLYLINEENSDFSIEVSSVDGRITHTNDMYFIPRLENQENAQVLIMDTSPGNAQGISFRYELQNTGFMLDFDVQSRGLSEQLSPRYPPRMTWTTQVFRNSKSIDYENRYTRLSYGYERNKDKKLGQRKQISRTTEDVRWISYKQHFFSSILIPDQPFKSVIVSSQNIAKNKELEERFTKKLTSIAELSTVASDVNESYQFYFGPTDFYLFRSMDGDLEKSIEMGWGIFGWINRFLFMPLFNFLSSYIPHGMAIILMTIIVRLCMSPVTYKSYVSQVKMRILKPEVQEIGEKYKDNPVKRQQETMALYTKAGASPLSGCIPALLQLPVFYALFLFFPAAFSLRQKSFLWADDLASYDSILDLPFNIPFYGDHVSLFPILASVAIFFYTRMTMSQQTLPSQPGMPNMKVLMSIMPVFMLFFFNNYASGLSLYYFVSNLLTILLMLVIKNYIINQDKVHAQIEVKKKRKPKPGGFTARLQKAMEEAERQKQLRNRK